MKQIILSGFGGQGMLLAGQLIAYAGMIENQFVTWLPSYGPEMRGGAAYCSVVLSKRPVGCPLISSPDILVAMNQPSYDIFMDKVVSGGLIIYNSSLISPDKIRHDVQTVPVDVTNIANELKNSRVGNMIILGSLQALTGAVKAESILKALSDKFGEDKKHLLPVNEQALIRGAQAVQGVIAR